MRTEIVNLVKKIKNFYVERGFPHRCLAREDIDVAELFGEFGLSDSDSSFVYFYQNVIGPFAGNGKYPELLDVLEGLHSICSFSTEFWENFSGPKNVIAISEIASGVGLFYDLEKDTVFEVEMDVDFGEFMSGELEPNWKSFDEFLIAFFEE